MSTSLSKRVGDDPSVRRPAALARALARFGALLRWLWRPRGIDLEHLDHDGPALVVGNHSGGPLALFEPLLLALVASKIVPLARLPHLLLHEIMWRTPLARALAALGAVRATTENAEAILRAGGRVLVYPGGDREPFRSFRDRDRIALGDRRGYLKLALREGVPIIPVVTTGVQSGFVCLGDGHAFARRFPLARYFRVGVLPITLSFPFGLWLGVPPPYIPLFARARIRALSPIRFARQGEEAARDEAYVEACHRRVLDAMQDALDDLARARREERRASMHSALDATLDLLERWSLATPPRTRAPSTNVLPLEAGRARASLVPAQRAA